MIYLMKQKLFSWGDDFVIKDQAGQDHFLVDGKASVWAINFHFRIWQATNWHSSGKSF